MPRVDPDLVVVVAARCPRKALNDFPPSDFHVTMLPVNTMSGFVGCTFTSAKSEPLSVTRGSAPTIVQLSPPSSDRYRPPLCRASIVRKSRLGRLGAIAMPIRPRPSARTSKPGRQLAPGAPAVRGLVEPAARAAEGPVLPRTLARFPQGRARCRGSTDRGPRPLRRCRIAAQHFLERPAAIDRPEQPPLLVRPARVPEDRDEQAIGRAGIDGDLRNLLAVAQAQVRPRAPAVVRTVDAIADRQVWTLEPRRCLRHDVRVRRGDGDGADRSGRLLVEDRVPVCGRNQSSPHAAVDRADVEHIGPLGYACRGFGASSAMWPYHAVAQRARRSCHDVGSAACAACVPCLSWECRAGGACRGRGRAPADIGWLADPSIAASGSASSRA